MNKKQLLIGGALLGVGCAIGYAMKVQQVGVLQVLPINSPVVNNAIQTLVKRGHAGNVVVCNETGEIFASQNRAAQMLGLDPKRLSEHVRGKLENVKGYTFTLLGEYDTSQ